MEAGSIVVFPEYLTLRPITGNIASRLAVYPEKFADYERKRTKMYTESKFWAMNMCFI